MRVPQILFILDYW